MERPDTFKALVGINLNDVKEQKEIKDKQTGRVRNRLDYISWAWAWQRLHELYPDAEIENFYTDSMNDSAMMDISEHVYLVKKDKITKIK